jgi:hypothetical protein
MIQFSIEPQITVGPPKKEFPAIPHALPAATDRMPVAPDFNLSTYDMAEEDGRTLLKVSAGRVIECISPTRVHVPACLLGNKHPTER